MNFKTFLRRMLVTLLNWILFLIILFVFIDISPFSNGFLNVITSMGIIFVFIIGNKRKCPNCKVLFMKKKLSSEYIGSDTEYDTVTREDEVTNKRGNTVGYIERNEQVAVNCDTYDYSCKCRLCGYKWTERITYKG